MSITLWLALGACVGVVAFTVAVYRAGVRAGLAKQRASETDALMAGDKAVAASSAAMNREREATERSVHAALAGGVDLGDASRELSSFGPGDDSNNPPAA